MSYYLSQLEGRERRTECRKHDEEFQASVRMTCPTCSRTGRCNPNAGRGQGRDCAASLAMTQAIALFLSGFVVAALRFVRMLPARLDLEYLRWARAHLTKHNPQHPDLPGIVLRINHLEEVCRA